MKERDQQDPEPREQRKPDDFKLPEERVEDIEPQEEDSAEIKGGGFPKKIEYGT